MATGGTILTIDDLNAVYEALFNARAKWKDIGGGIGVDEGTLDTMKGPDNDCLRGTLKHWLKGVYKPGEQNSKPRTWHTLIEALQAKAVNEEAMAEKLKKLDTTQLQASGSTATASPTTFSDALSPTDLVSWLSQQFQAKGLTLDPSLGQKLIDNDINGEAFLDLDDSYLDKMGFKIGQRMKIVKIIQSAKGGKTESFNQHQTVSKPIQEDKAPSDTSEPTILMLTRLKGKDGKEVEIMKAVTPKWQEFGQHLDFDPVGGHLDTINKRNRDPADSCKEMFQHWLNGNGIPATWSNVIDVLDAIGLKVLAKNVKAIISSY